MCGQAMELCGFEKERDMDFASVRKGPGARAILMGAALGIALSGAVHGQTADELVAKNLAARGGEANIKAISSLRQTGKLEQGGIVILLGLDQKPDDLIRESASIQGMTQVQAYDGTEAWQINPFQGRRDPERMGEDDTRDLVEGADFYGPLVDYAKKGSKVEYVGHAQVDGDDALLLKVTLKNGDIFNYFLDPDTYLEIRTERLMFVRGSVRESFSNLGSYKKVNGVYFPFSVEQGSVRNPGFSTQITFTKIEANVDIPDAEFKMPAAPKAPAAAPAADGKPTPAL
jgi:outer membrane lipoprotein-sorting protein